MVQIDALIGALPRYKILHTLVMRSLPNIALKSDQIGKIMIGIPLHFNLLDMSDNIIVSDKQPLLKLRKSFADKKSINTLLLGKRLTR
jgi:hypothetical protein